MWLAFLHHAPHCRSWERTCKSLGRVDWMFRVALAGMLLLSIMATAQTARRVGSAPPDSAPAVSPISSCVWQGPARALLADSFSSIGSGRLDVFAQDNRLLVEVNHAAPSAAATTPPDLPQAPSAVPGGRNSTDDAHDLSGTRFVPPTLTVEQNTNNKRWRTLDNKFILLHTLSTVALVADLETTVRGLAAQPKATELNPIFGEHPTRARLYGIAVPLNAVSLYLSYHYKKTAPSRSVWKLGPEMSIAVHTAAAINNLIVTHR